MWLLHVSAGRRTHAYNPVGTYILQVSIATFLTLQAKSPDYLSNRYSVISLPSFCVFPTSLESAS